MFYTVYKITNTTNGKFYIGKHQTKDLNDKYMGSGKILKEALSKYGIDSFRKEILFVFDELHLSNQKEKELIRELSPEYNIAKGGDGGYTSYNKDRNEKISNSLRGRDVSKWIEKTTKKNILSGHYNRKNNPNSKKWQMTDPNGNTYILEGNLETFCDENSLIVSSLKYYIGCKVPEITTNKFGGYRKKNENSHKLRLNTVGWKLNKIDNGG